jgi:2OG-Fe(II) oxygenase superfamily.
MMIGAIHPVVGASISSCCFSRSARTKSTTTSLLSFLLRQQPHGSRTRRNCKHDRRSNPTIRIPPHKLYSSTTQQQQQRPSSHFHPLGPPESLSHLAIGDECCISIRPPSPRCISSPISSPLSPTTTKTTTAKKLIIQRLSQNPDIFLAKNFLSQEQTRSNLIQYATKQGMKLAGTRQSIENTVRKNSYLTWLNRHEILASLQEDGTNQDSAVLVANIVESMGQCVLNTFLHESLQSSSLLNQKVEEKEEAVTLNLVLEDLQIAKYDQGGKFEEHHDGYGRFLTVLTYLNGVGGTFFPFAQTQRRQKSPDDEEEEEERVQLQTRDGLLVVGKEGIEAYNYTIPTTRSLSDSTSTSTNSASAAAAESDREYQQQEQKDKIQPATVVHIEPGDALVFYNYLLGKRDLQSVHESLTVPCEKWIATNWVRCENLTGPLAHLYYERLVSSSMYYPRQQQQEEERDRS